MTEMQDAKWKVTVFVKRVKRVITEKVGYHTIKVERRFGLSGGDAPKNTFPLHKERTVTKDEFVLPDEQQETVDMVMEIASSHGFEVEVVDVTKEDAFRRDIREHAKHVQSFPTVIIGDERRIEGDITKQQVEALLTNEHKYLWILEAWLILFTVRGTTMTPFPENEKRTRYVPNFPFFVARMMRPIDS